MRHERHTTERLMSVPVETADGFRAGTPTALFDVNRFEFGLANHSNYDIGPDGRFLFVKPVDAPGDGASEIVVVLNWLEQLTRLVSHRLNTEPPPRSATDFASNLP